MRFAIVLLLLLLQSACAYSQRGSDEWWYDRMQRDHRSQCNQLPAQVKAQCLERQGELSGLFETEKISSRASYNTSF